MRWLGVKEAGAKHEPGYPLVSGPRYEKWLTAFHESHSYEWYLEIGTETGKSLRNVSGNVIAIDPVFRMKFDFTGSKERIHLFQMSSDDFFRSGFLEKNSISVDVAFIDGMHEFEYVLRDFMNLEDASNEKTCIFLHDCIPINSIQARREQKSFDSRFWAGDVWKILPILDEYRPDLCVRVLDLAPTGLVMVAQLSPGNVTLRNNYDEIVQRFENMSMQDYGLEKFRQKFAFIDVAA